MCSMNQRRNKEQKGKGERWGLQHEQRNQDWKKHSTSKNTGNPVHMDHMGWKNEARQAEPDDEKF